MISLALILKNLLNSGTAMMKINSLLLISKLVLHIMESIKEVKEIIIAPAMVDITTENLKNS